MLRNFRALKMAVSLESVMHNNGQRDTTAIGVDGSQLRALVDAAVDQPWLAKLPTIQVLRDVWETQYIKVTIAQHKRDAGGRRANLFAL
jgi:hypothetical protein